MGTATEETVEVIDYEDWIEEGKELFGDDPMFWEFVCPHCGTVQTGNDLKKAGLDEEEIHGALGFSCIGRFDPDQGCDWTLGGLLQIHTREIAQPEQDKNRPVFEFNTDDTHA